MTPILQRLEDIHSGVDNFLQGQPRGPEPMFPTSPREGSQGQPSHLSQADSERGSVENLLEDHNRFEQDNYDNNVPDEHMETSMAVKEEMQDVEGLPLKSDARRAQDRRTVVVRVFERTCFLPQLTQMTGRG